MDSLAWLQQWYLSRCNEEWEFAEGIKILSVSNPGWSVEISVADTKLADSHIPFKLVRNSNNDWHGYLIEDGIFTGSGDPNKLSFIIELFRNLLEN